MPKRAARRKIEFVDSKNNLIAERCLYKLKKLGMIEKYTVELVNDISNGTEYARKYIIHTNIYKKITVEKNMFSYIKTFIPNFNINDNLL